MPKGGVPSCWRAEERDATALTCSLRLPTPTPPRSSPAPSLTLSFQRTLGSRRAAIRHGSAFYINDKVWARGGRGPAGGGAGTKPPAGCSKRRSRQGRADVSRRVAKPRRAQRSAGERVSLASPGPSGAGRALGRRRSGLALSAAEIEARRPPSLLPAPVTPSDPGARLPRSAAWARAGRHLHFGDSAVGKCPHRAVESQSGSRRLLASGQLPKLRQPDSPREGRAGIWVSVGHRVKLTAAAATSHPTPTPARRPLLLGLVALAGKLGAECPPPGMANPRQTE